MLKTEKKKCYFQKNILDEDCEDPEDPPTKIPVNEPANDPTAGPELQAVEKSTRSNRLKSDARDDFTQEDETTVSRFKNAKVTFFFSR